MGLFTNTNDFIYTSNSYNSPISNEIINDNGRVVSLLGPSIKGKSFIPQGFTSYNNFSKVCGSVKEHYKEYQGKIDSILTSYITLNSNAQLNYTRLLGINKSTFNNLPGFKIGEFNTNKIYALGFKVNLKSDDDLSRYNKYLINKLSLSNNSYILAGFIVTSNNVTIKNNNLSKNEITVNGVNKSVYKFELNDTSNKNYSDENNNPKGGDSEILDKIISGNITPPKVIFFNFEKEDEYYWKKSFNFNIKRINDYGYTFLNVYDCEEEFEEVFKSNEYFLEEITDVDKKDFNQGFKNAFSPWFVSQGYYNGDQSKNRSDDLDLKSRIKKLFRFHSLHDGSYGNNLIVQIEPKSLGDDSIWATFDLKIIDKNTQEFENYNDLNLNTEDQNYIGRRIGNQFSYFDINGSDHIVESGIYPIQSNLVWIEISDEVERGLIGKETIPCGFIEKRKLKTISIGQSTTISNSNYLIQPIFDIQTNNSNNLLKINDKNSWGIKLYNKNVKKSFDISEFNSVYQKILNGVNQQISGSIKYYQYNLDEYGKIKTNNYLPDSYFDEITDLNLTNDDIFHIEKIILTNEEDFTQGNSIVRRRWDLSLYNNKGDNITSNDFIEDIIENSTNNTFYYYTVTKKDYEIPKLSSVENEYQSSLQNITPELLRFTSELSGGWDGLNIFDIDQVVMNDKGIKNNSYIEELYKYGMDIIFENTNGLNNFIYVPGIKNEEIINHALNEIDNNFRFKSFYIYDNYLYDSEYVEVDHHDLYKIKTVVGNQNLKWSDQIYETKSVNEINIDENISIVNWNQNVKSNKYVASFGNYFEMEIPSTSDEIPENIFELNFNSSIVLPSGIIALKSILDSGNISSITDSLNGSNILFNFNIKNVSTLFNDKDTLWSNQTSKYLSNSKVNCLITKNNINEGSNVLGFEKSRTLYYQGRTGQSLSNLIMYRLILNEIKRIIENNVNRNLLFQTISTKNETLQINRSSIQNIMDTVQNAGLITSYVVKLDEKTTSDEDLLNNVVRGEIELQFPGQQINLIDRTVKKVETMKI